MEPRCSPQPGADGAARRGGAEEEEEEEEVARPSAKLSAHWWRGGNGGESRMRLLPPPPGGDGAGGGLPSSGWVPLLERGSAGRDGLRLAGDAREEDGPGDLAGDIREDAGASSSKARPLWINGSRSRCGDESSGHRGDGEPRPPPPGNGGRRLAHNCGELRRSVLALAMAACFRLSA